MTNAQVADRFDVVSDFTAGHYFSPPDETDPRSSAADVGDYELVCHACERPFLSVRRRTRFCGTKCRDMFYQRASRRRQKLRWSWAYRQAVARAEA